jgi:hypothetical protein
MKIAFTVGFMAFLFSQLPAHANPAALGRGGFAANAHYSFRPSMNAKPEVHYKPSRSLHSPSFYQAPSYKAPRETLLPRVEYPQTRLNLPETRLNLPEPVRYQEPIAIEFPKPVAPHISAEILNKTLLTELRDRPSKPSRKPKRHEGNVLVLEHNLLDIEHPSIKNILAPLPQDYQFVSKFLKKHQPYRLQHATHVAETLAKDSEDIPVRIHPRVLNSDSLKSLYRTILRARAKGVRVVNISFHKLYTRDSAFQIDLNNPRLRRMIEGNDDMIFVAAAGNHTIDLDHTDQILYPQMAGYKNLIVVASVDPIQEAGEEYRLSSFSNRGANTVHLAAVGKDIPFSAPVSTASGTSFAAPQVARTCAKILAINPDLTADQVKEILQHTVTPSSHLYETQWGGVLDEKAALREARRTTESLHQLGLD